MAELILTPRQRQTLKARAHTLRPMVQLGSAGLTENVLREIDRALADHQLIKVRVATDDRQQRMQIFDAIADKTSAAKVQSVGKLIVLFRPAPESEERQSKSIED